MINNNNNKNKNNNNKTNGKYLYQDSKNQEPLSRLHSISYDSSTMPQSLKHLRNQTAPPLMFNRSASVRLHDTENKCKISKIK